MSTRPKSHHHSKSAHFEKGEKCLCYEPNPDRAKVLYEIKILGTYETKDKRGRSQLQYKVHFQGWSSSWDKKVNANLVLKDTEANRQLQRDLAERAQLQLGAYLYRKEGRVSSKKSSSSRKAASLTASDSGGGTPAAAAIPAAAEQCLTYSPKTPRPRGSSEDNYSSGSTFEKHDDYSMKDDCETESCCSSGESLHDEERVQLRISERLRQYLEYDHDMIIKYSKQHALPSRIPVVTILENFVKQSAMKLVFSSQQTESTRRRTTQQRTDKKEREFDKLVATVSLLKEVADGLRIYFDFTVADYLLYKEEKDYALSYLSEESLKNFTYIASSGLTSDYLNPKCAADGEQSTSGSVGGGGGGGGGGSFSLDGGAAGEAHESVNYTDEPQKRKLRSYRSDDGDLMFENCLSSIASTSSGASTPLHSYAGTSVNYLKSLQPMTLSIPPQSKDFLQSVLSWRLLPSNAMPAASMIFGAPHLARLIVKLPEFLNASSINDEKLKILLQHLDSFTNYLEAHKEWFNEDNYSRSSVPFAGAPGSKTASVAASAEQTKTVSTEQQQQQHADVNTTTTSGTTTISI